MKPNTDWTRLVFALVWMLLVSGCIFIIGMRIHTDNPQWPNARGAYSDRSIPTG